MHVRPTSQASSRNSTRGTRGTTLAAAHQRVGSGRVFIGTQDCRVIALDAATGKPVWNVVSCRDTTDSWYSMPSYVYCGTVIPGTAGGDNGNRTARA